MTMQTPPDLVRRFARVTARTGACFQALVIQGLVASLIPGIVETSTYWFVPNDTFLTTIQVGRVAQIQ